MALDEDYSFAQLERFGNYWIADSGSTSHVTNSMDGMCNLQKHFGTILTEAQRIDTIKVRIKEKRTLHTQLINMKEKLTKKIRATFPSSRALRTKPVPFTFFPPTLVLNFVEITLNV